MAITRLGGANAISGTIPQGNIANASLGAVTALPAGVGGKVLQVVQASKNDAFSTSSATYVDVTGVTADITPSSTSNKILVQCFVGKFTNNASSGSLLQLDRGGTSIYDSNTGGNADDAFATEGGGGMTNNDRKNGVGFLNFLDSPSSTSSLTYKLRLRQGAASSDVAYVNRWGLNNDQSGVTTLTLIEIAG